MQKGNIVAVFVFLAFLVVGALTAFAMRNPLPIVPWIIAGIIAAQSPRIAQQWERGIVLRLGKFQSMRGPGLFWVIPFVDTVLFWMVYDAKKTDRNGTADADRSAIESVGHHRAVGRNA